ncbi:MAG: ABC transporter ATP-binding protein [Gammaproteobacteria bacterium]|nr:ABC transporter ATP-binding protein [Gammaproteobacteria bacterium]
MTAGGNILELQNLRVRFKHRKHAVAAVRDASFQLRRGQTLALVGESGSGKSVASLALMGLLPDHASVEARRMRFVPDADAPPVDLTDQRPETMRRLRGRHIAMVFQEPMSSLNPLFPIGDQIGEALLVHERLDARSRRKRVLEMLELVEIPGAAERHDAWPHELSGGMRQRVLIALALVCKPALLIADEPTTALDVTIQAQILDLMRRLQAELGMSILFITHDLGVVAEMADEVAVMRAGEVVEQAAVGELFSDPRHPYTRGLLASLPNGRRAALSQTASESVEPEVPPPPEPLVSMPLVSIKGMSKIFPSNRGAVHAVQDVSFDIPKGAIVGLVGESGSGKTTLGRAVLRLVEPTAGSVVFDGEILGELDASRMRAMRRRMQIIFQDPVASLNPRMRVRDIVAEGLLAHGIGTASSRAERVAALLEEVGLKADDMRRHPHEFSGGQRQRIGIARALALDPDFIIADESVSALDVSIRSQVLDLLLDIRRRREATLLFISHDLSVVRYLCDLTAVMYLGRLVEFGATEAVHSQPAHPYTRALLTAVPVPDPGAARGRELLQGDAPSPLAPPSGCVFRTRCRHAAPACAEAMPALARWGPDREAACARLAEIA